MVRTALRPYMTTGIAIAGASLIAVAPVIVTPPDLPAVEVAALDAVRSVTADVELTASWVDLVAAVPEVAALILQAALQPLPLPAELESLAVALVKAGVPAVTETIKLWTETLPATAQSLIAAGKFAHLAVLAANTVYLGTLTPIAPFAVALMDALPLPIGTQGGALNELLKLGIQTPFVAGTSVLTLLAQVVDDGLPPAAVITGTIDAVSIALTSAVESIQKIVNALGGALPISAKVAPEARSMAAAGDLPAANDANVLAANVNSATVTVDVSPSQKDTGTPVADGGSDDESAREDQPDDKPKPGLTSNGATDLSDGNMAQPGTTHDSSSGGDNDHSTTEADTTAEAASENQTTTANNSSTGSNEATGDEEPSGE